MRIALYLINGMVIGALTGWRLDNWRFWLLTCWLFVFAEVYSYLDRVSKNEAGIIAEENHAGR